MWQSSSNPRFGDETINVGTGKVCLNSDLPIQYRIVCCIHPSHASLGNFSGYHESGNDRYFGLANLVLSDPIADMVIAVTQGNEQLVTVYWGMARTSLDCAPDCQPVMMVGDDTGFTAETISSANMVEGAAN